YIAVIGFVSRAVLLKRGVSVGLSILKEKMAANNSSFVMVTEERNPKTWLDELEIG
ncbi:hypothetical protein G9A89_000075, partial [Geosiphon pyriformis]